MLKSGDEALVCAITSLFNLIIDQKPVVPDSWRAAVISVIFKDGSPKMPSNYRPISIVPILYKLFARVLLGRLTPILEKAQKVDQAGFRANFSTTDHLFALTQLQEKTDEWQEEVWIAFVDYRKAFDTVSHCGLWKALEKQGVPAQYIRLLSEMYTGSIANVVLDKLSKQFSILRGVKQGDPASPALFNALLEDVFEEIKRGWKGISIEGAGEPLTNLRFADDVMLVARSLDELRNMLEDLRIASKERGLEMHPGKTKIMTNQGDKRVAQCSKVPLGDGSNIDVLKKDAASKYLGRLVSFSNRHEVEVDNRIKQAWKKFHVQKHILCNRSFSLKKRVQLLDITVKPTILYGAGTWALTANMCAKLRKTQRQMLRSIFQKGRQKVGKEMNSDTGSSNSIAQELECEEYEPWHVWIKRATREIEDCISKWSLEDWVSGYRRAVFHWAGHVARRTDGRWSQLLLDWIPEGGKHQGGAGQGRRQGRPKLRWSDLLDDYFRDEHNLESGAWRIIAMDRESWAQLCESFVVWTA